MCVNKSNIPNLRPPVPLGTNQIINDLKEVDYLGLYKTIILD